MVTWSGFSSGEGPQHRGALASAGTASPGPKSEGCLWTLRRGMWADWEAKALNIINKSKERWRIDFSFKSKETLEDMKIWCWVKAWVIWFKVWRGGIGTAPARSAPAARGEESSRCFVGTAAGGAHGRGGSAHAGPAGVQQLLGSEANGLRGKGQWVATRLGHTPQAGASGLSFFLSFFSQAQLEKLRREVEPRRRSST